LNYGSNGFFQGRPVQREKSMMSGRTWHSVKTGIVIFMGLLRGWKQRPLGAPIFYRLWAAVPAASVVEASVLEGGMSGSRIRGATPEPVKNRRFQYGLPGGSNESSLKFHDERP
jgi:hypothetical protein